MLRLVETRDDSYHLEQDGRPLLLPRVTAVLSVVRDLSAIPAETLARAAARGRAVHRAVWLLEAGGDGSGLAWDTLHYELMPYVQAYQAAKAALGFRVIWKEQLVASAVFGYAGRVDLVVAWKNRLGILDLKTGEEHPSHRLQVSAYLEAYRETVATRKRLERWILYLRPTGGYRLDDCTTGPGHEQDFKSFTHVLAVYRWLQAQRNGN